MRVKVLNKKNDNQSEYNALTVLLNLDKISQSKAEFIIDSIPQRALIIISS